MLAAARSPDNCPALVLNADFRPLSYFPLSLWSWQDAIKAVFLERVNILEEYDRKVHSPSFEMRIPSVVSLKTYIRPARNPAFTRFNVFLRDRFECQYCGAEEDLTFDHVGREDRQLIRGPFLGADECESQLRVVEERRARVPAPELERAQLTPTVGELDRDPDVGDEVDAEIGEMRAPTEVGRASRTIAEGLEVPATRSAVQRALLGLELGGIDERFRSR